VEDKTLLHIRGLTTVLETRSGTVTPVNNVDIKVPRNRSVGLVGESGCGKSMTALSVMGLLPPSGKIAQGSINLGDQDLSQLSPKAMRAITGSRISMIFQEPMTSLNPVMTVGKQVREAITLHQNVSRSEANRMVVDIFRQVGIPDPERRFRSFPHQLSGGLRQRVMIGMAMVCEPDLLIADEPTTALDVTIEAQILHLMRALIRQKGTSILMITHNMGVVAEICDTVYVMYAGEVVEHCDVFELFRNPRHPYSIGLMGALPKIDKRERLANIPGVVPSLNNLPPGCRFHPRCSHASERCKTTRPGLYQVADGHFARCLLYETSDEGIDEGNKENDEQE
jgi:peptide/nickel transport system ATP-binding protein